MSSTVGFKVLLPSVLNVDPFKTDHPPVATGSYWQKRSTMLGRMYSPLQQSGIGQMPPRREVE